jgi:polysaccharide pyruvyl transferase WcaK-like protein
VNLVIAGAPADTFNLGVSALLFSAIDGLSKRLPGARFSVLCHASDHLPSVDVPGVRVDCVGVSLNRRIHRPDSWWRVNLALRLGLRNRVADVFRDATCVLDVSGGDSFSDLYGDWRLASINAPKLAAISAKVPLVLLPQTFGPFAKPKNRATAAELICNARLSCARDQRSYALLAALRSEGEKSGFKSGGSIRAGVDLAFLLPRRDAAEATHRDLIGINVSGLLWNDPANALKQYGITADYRRAVIEIVSSLARQGEVVLVPHVNAHPGHFESDPGACLDVLKAIPAEVRASVRTIEPPKDPCEAKGLISRCSWFMGTRMHATIAGLSSGVPTCAISYSDKTLGVFETCGQGEHVHDPRKLDTETLVERVLWSFSQREAARASLATHLPGVLKQAEEQMDEIARVIREAHESRSSGHSGSGRGNAAAGRGSST